VIDDDGSISTRDFANILNMSTRRLQLLAEEGVLIRPDNGRKGRFDFTRSLVALVQNLEQRLKTGAQRVNHQRELKLMADRELVEVKIAEKQGALVPRLHIEMLMAQYASDVTKVHDRVLADIKQISKDSAGVKIFEEGVNKIRRRGAQLRLLDEREAVALADDDGSEIPDDDPEPSI
jgi:DNA-binding transcriptional MerR regulator